MRLRISTVLPLFFFLLTLASCENPSDIGLNLQGHTLGTSFEKSQVTASTILAPDSILSFRAAPILVGKVNDGEFGTLTAGHYTRIGLNGTNVSFDPATNPQDSAVLVLAYTGYYYGDTTTAIKVNVHRLAEDFREDKSYFTTDQLNTSDLLGSLTFKPKKNRTTRNGAEFSRLLRIPLSKAFADELLSKSGQTALSTQQEFQKYFKGIAITADPSSGAGSIVGFTTFPDSAGTQLGNVAGLRLYFKDKAGAQQVHTFSFNGEAYFTGLKATRQGTKLASLVPGQELSSTETGNVTYIQENTGVKTRLIFPGIENFQQGKGQVYINYAELILPVNNTTASGKVTNPAEAIFLYESSPGKKVARTPGGNVYTIQRGDASAFGVTKPIRVLYNSDSAFYKADITSYVQALIEKKKTNNGIIVSPVAEDYQTATLAGLSSFPGTVTANRSVISTSGKGVQLRIYYSKLN